MTAQVVTLAAAALVAVASAQSGDVVAKGQLCDSGDLSTCPSPYECRKQSIESMLDDPLFDTFSTCCGCETCTEAQMGRIFAGFRPACSQTMLGLLAGGDADLPLTTLCPCYLEWAEDNGMIGDTEGLPDCKPPIKGAACLKYVTQACGVATGQGVCGLRSLPATTTGDATTAPPSTTANTTTTGGPESAAVNSLVGVTITSFAGIVAILC